MYSINTSIVEHIKRKIKIKHPRQGVGGGAQKQGKKCKNINKIIQKLILNLENWFLEKHHQIITGLMQFLLRKGRNNWIAKQMGRV